MFRTFFIETGHSFWYLLLNAEYNLVGIINIALNCYWSWLIIQQIIRIFTRGASAAETSFEGQNSEKFKGQKHVELTEVSERDCKD